MASLPGYADRPPLQGFRRSFTAPHRQLSIHERAGLSDADAGTETLFTHPSVRIISFAPPPESIVSKSSETDADADYPIDTIETLPWRSRTEDLAASGGLIIEKVKGSVVFLKRGQNFSLPILRNTQVWCVDGESKFVWRKRRFQYYRLEFPTTTEEEKNKVEELKLALAKVLRFEKTPCPFKRGFHVDLPDDAITPRRKGKWTRKEGSLPATPDSNSPFLRRTKGARSLSLQGESAVPVPESRRQSHHGFAKRLYPAPSRRDAGSGLRPETPSSEASSEDVSHQDQQDCSDNGSSMDDPDLGDREDHHIEDESHSPQVETEDLEVNGPTAREDTSADAPKKDIDPHIPVKDHMESSTDAGPVEDKHTSSPPMEERKGTESHLEEGGHPTAEAAEDTGASKAEVILRDTVEERHAQDDFDRYAQADEVSGTQVLVSEDTSTELRAQDDFDRYAQADEVSGTQVLVNEDTSTELPAPIQPPIEVDEQLEEVDRSKPKDEDKVEPESVTAALSDDLAEEPVPLPEEHEAPAREDEDPYITDVPEPNQAQDVQMKENLSESAAADEPLDDAASVASTADSFHSVASIEQLPLHEKKDVTGQPEPVEYLTTHFQHKRGVSEMTITASNFDGQDETAERPSTPHLIQSSASDESWPDIQTPSNISEGLRQRLRSRRSASPLSSSSNVFTPSAPNHGNHMTAVLLQKACNLALVKPIEFMVMVVHILARIAGGASLNDLLTGELFKRPVQHKRNSSFPDRISPQHDEEEDDFGVPLRGRTRNSEVNGSTPDRDTDADSMFDLD